MTAREKIAWLAFAVTAVALAAAVIMPRYGKAPAPADSKPAVRADDRAQLDRIERRLESLESAQRVVSSNPASTLETNKQGSASPHRTEPEPDPASVAAMEQNRLVGIALVDRAIQAGYWSRKDTEAWIAAAGGMRGEDRFELHRRLIVEINADRLKLEPGASIR